MKGKSPDCCDDNNNTNGMKGKSSDCCDDKNNNKNEMKGKNLWFFVMRKITQIMVYQLE